MTKEDIITHQLVPPGDNPGQWNHHSGRSHGPEAVSLPPAAAAVVVVATVAARALGMDLLALVALVSHALVQPVVENGHLDWNKEMQK